MGREGGAYLQMKGDWVGRTERERGGRQREMDSETGQKRERGKWRPA